MGLAAEGARVAICGRDERVLEQARDEIVEATRAEVICVKANMTRVNDIRRFFSTAHKKFNRIDILVNNAGARQIGTIEDITDGQWEEQIELKMLGYIRAAREVIPYMRQNGGGRIVNIADIAGREPSPQNIAPTVINAALIAMTKTLSKSLERDRIVVNAVCPGATDTMLTTEEIASLAVRTQKSPEEIRQGMIESSPLGRLAAPDEIARVAVFLASEAAGFINGVALNADAGKTAGV